ncbi:conserved hypothetical protein [Pediculus humanus corporis]|uniref:Uncharacterized protein n=1 Tax=Pediculus humanus subsp. corporis TaxID=121224 RepID=E0W2U0_PEDHC|nr:uncharacterized protein Phum_PHUM596930 [Pediculus humanus corporis]EEB19946.1 conserved hypothetical protein [Pediculus humanus corporis]
MNDMFDVKKSSSSKALELINKYIDVPEPEVKNLNFICDEKKENLIETEMNELNKELEELKKEEERFNKTYVTRTTSTSSLEDEFVKRLQERNYKNVYDVLNDNLPKNLKAKRPESLPPGNLMHLLQSVRYWEAEVVGKRERVKENRLNRQGEKKREQIKEHKARELTDRQSQKETKKHVERKRESNSQAERDKNTQIAQELNKMSGSDKNDENLKDSKPTINVSQFFHF